MRDQNRDYNAMMNRFGQPRQLVSLSLMTVIESPPRTGVRFRVWIRSPHLPFSREEWGLNR